MILTKDFSFMEERECDALEEDEGATISIINMAPSEYDKSSESFRNRPAMKGNREKDPSAQQLAARRIACR